MPSTRTLVAGAAVLTLAAAGVAAAARPHGPPPPLPPARLAIAPSQAQTAPPSGSVMESTTHFGAAGPVTIYRTTREPDRFVIFVSGDGGWNEGVVDMARQLALLSEIGARLAAVGIDAGRAYVVPLRQQDLADAVGISMVHANRVFQALKANGAVEVTNGGFRILNPAVLHTAGSFDPAYLHLRPVG